jgi:hypothetical protein
LTRVARWVLLGLTAAVACAPARGVAADGTTAPPTAATPPAAPLSTGAVPATWTEHKITFAYQGLTTHYSCEGLKHKMGDLLRYFGARPKGIRLRAYGCAGGAYRPSPAINLEMEFATLAPSAEGAAAGVTGAWVERDIFPQTQISREAPSHITRGDCELIQKFVAAVLPSFTHEIVQDLTRCIPYQLDGTVPNLRVRVLAPQTDRGEAP